ncbi:MAG: tRNA pseudouridine(55) synthase TruB [Azospirillum brasilense]|nr:MAG: tRNA pseudouridine(55) synthase TruB [Azospirillum brasilense]
MNKPKLPRQRINGWINLHKPLGMSSAQAVNKVKWLLRPEKIGHAGTLDPLASGVLPLALGEATKCVNLLMDARKTYHFAVTFGQQRNTDDAEGEVVATSAHMPSEADIRAVLPQFTGRIEQTPPAYSAIKVDGKRAYALARAGEAVEMKSREVTVYALNLLDFDGQVASFEAVVSKGTYIRSLGRDLAVAVGSVGYISRLHRAAVGPFADADAISLDFIEETIHNAPANAGELAFVMPPSVALDDIPALTFTAQQVQTLRHGQQVLLPPMPDTPLAGVLLQGQLVALVRVEGNHAITQRMLNL